MKKIILILLLAISFASFGQTKPTYTHGLGLIKYGNIIFVGNYDTTCSCFTDTTMFIMENANPQIWSKTKTEFFGPLISKGYFNTDSSIYVHGYDLIRYKDSKESVYLGRYCGTNNTGENFSGVGNFVGFGNTTNNFTGMGFHCGDSNKIIDFVGFGDYAGYKNRGQYFTGVSGYCGKLNTGKWFSGLGYNCGYENTGKYFMGFGYEAGYANTLDSVLYIGKENQTGHDSLTTLLYGRMSKNKERLRINGWRLQG